MIRVLLCLLLLLAALLPARAQPQPSGLTAEQAKAVIGVLENPAERAALVAALQAAAKPAAAAAPAAAQAATPPAAPSGATTPPAAPPAAAAPAAAKPGPKAPTIAPDSVAAQLVTQGSAVAAEVGSQTISVVRTVTDFPLLWFWASSEAANPDKRAAILDVLGHAAIAFAAALAAERLVMLLLRRPRAAVARSAPAGRPGTREAGSDEAVGAEQAIADAEAGETEKRVRNHGRMRAALTLLRRLPYALMALVIDLAPVLVFAVLIHLIGGTGLGSRQSTRLAIAAIGVAYVVGRLVVVVAGILASPRAPSLRLLLASDALAAFLMRWVRRVVAVAATGYALATVGLALGLYPAAAEALLRLTGLLVNLCIVAAIIEIRHPVARRIAGRGGGGMSGIRRRLAESWHVLAIVLLLGIWFVYAIELPNGMETLLRLLGLSLLVLAGARLFNIMTVGALARALPGSDAPTPWPALQGRATRYVPALRHTLNVLVAAATLVVLLQVWGVGAFGWFTAGALGGRVLATLVQIAVSVALVVVVWEAVNLWLQAQLARLAEQGHAVRAARLRTLLPMMRTALMVSLLLLLVLTTLSEIGVDIAPLLAGAGIIGVAIGFGSQKLVQDLINGIFLLLENAMQVGDWVTAGGLSGSVEYLSIRTIRLRAGDGSVHIIPFSAVTTVTNVNRGIGNVPINVEVEFGEDVERVFDGLREVATGLRADPTFARGITGDLQLWGVDRVEAQTVAIAGQIPCTDASRWPVQREFNRRWKLYVAEHAIALARHPQEWALRHPLDVRVDPAARASARQEAAPPEGAPPKGSPPEGAPKEDSRGEGSPPEGGARQAAQ